MSSIDERLLERIETAFLRKPEIRFEERTIAENLREDVDRWPRDWEWTVLMRLSTYWWNHLVLDVVFGESGAGPFRSQFSTYINHQDKDGQTALMWAMWRGHSRAFGHVLVQRLIAEGADPMIQDIHGHTVLMHAARLGHSSLSVLCQAVPKETLQKMVSQQANDGKTALMVAVWSGDLDCVQELLKVMTTEDINLVDQCGNSALFYARLFRDMPSRQGLCDQEVVDLLA